ncbi:MAG: FeoA family protein [Hydrogenovibrio sp.]|nr:FeoA family protein [Hydrogenovibrio sp.]
MDDQNIISLDQCQQNQTGHIVALTGDLETKLHLVNLGFHTQSHIKVFMIRGDCFILSVDGSRFAIDRKIARHIKVHLLS